MMIKSLSAGLRSCQRLLATGYLWGRVHGVTCAWMAVVMGWQFWRSKQDRLDKNRYHRQALIAWLWSVLIHIGLMCLADPGLLAATMSSLGFSLPQTIKLGQAIMRLQWQSLAWVLSKLRVSQAWLDWLPMVIQARMQWFQASLNIRSLGFSLFFSTLFAGIQDRRGVMHLTLLAASTAFLMVGGIYMILPAGYLILVIETCSLPMLLRWLGLPVRACISVFSGVFMAFLIQKPIRQILSNHPPPSEVGDVVVWLQPFQVFWRLQFSMQEGDISFNLMFFLGLLGLWASPLIALLPGFLYFGFIVVTAVLPVIGCWGLISQRLSAKDHRSTDCWHLSWLEWLCLSLTFLCLAPNIGHGLLGLIAAVSVIKGMALLITYASQYGSRFSDEPVVSRFLAWDVIMGFGLFRCLGNPWCVEAWISRFVVGDYSSLGTNQPLLRFLSDMDRLISQSWSSKLMMGEGFKRMLPTWGYGYRVLNQIGGFATRWGLVACGQQLLIWPIIPWLLVTWLGQSSEPSSVKNKMAKAGVIGICIWPFLHATAMMSTLTLTSVGVQALMWVGVLELLGQCNGVLNSLLGLDLFKIKFSMPRWLPKFGGRSWSAFAKVCGSAWLALLSGRIGVWSFKGLKSVRLNALSLNKLKGSVMVANSTSKQLLVEQSKEGYRFGMSVRSR